MRIRFAAAALSAAALSVTLAGCITINTGSATPSEAPMATPSSAPSPSADYSGALKQLSYAIGALAKSSQASATADDCAYTVLTADTMASATPAPDWQGTYESITANMRNVGGLCTIDPGSTAAQDLAATTRPDVVEILNREKFLGLNTWS